MANKIDPSVVARAVEEIDRDRLVQLVIDLTNIPSPTGYEGGKAVCCEFVSWLIRSVSIATVVLKAL